MGASKSGYVPAPQWLRRAWFRLARRSYALTTNHQRAWERVRDAGCKPREASAPEGSAVAKRAGRKANKKLLLVAAADRLLFGLFTGREWYTKSWLPIRSSTCSQHHAEGMSANNRQESPAIIEKPSKPVRDIHPAIHTLPPEMPANAPVLKNLTLRRSVVFARDLRFTLLAEIGHSDRGDYPLEAGICPWGQNFFDAGQGILI